MLTAIRCHEKSNKRLGETFSVHIHLSWMSLLRECNWSLSRKVRGTGRGDNRNRVGNCICEHPSFEHHSQVLSPAMQCHFGTEQNPDRHQGNSTLSRKGAVSQLFCLFHPHCFLKCQFHDFLFGNLDFKRIIYFQETCSWTSRPEVNSAINFYDTNLLWSFYIPHFLTFLSLNEIILMHKGL